MAKPSYRPGDNSSSPDSSLRPLRLFRTESKRNWRPQSKDLHDHVVPWWAPKWRQLGAELGVGDHLMDIIEHDHPNDCETCCRKMLDEWLDCSSSWDDVIVAVDNLFINGSEDIAEARSRLCEYYTQSRYTGEVDDWPPYHPQHYTPLTIIHHEGQCTVSGYAYGQSSTKILKSKDTFINFDRTINDIKDLLSPYEGDTFCPYRILIEGAPGVGKTMLSKEIALNWANKSLLSSKVLLFLIFMHDPQVKLIDNILSLVSYFYQSEVLACNIAKWLDETDGKFLTIILDGYDEVSEDNKSRFIWNVVNRKWLTQCGLVITSRPTSSAHLHDLVDCRAEVLGFTEENRNKFIQSTLKEQLDKIKKIEQFLQSNPILNTLCYIPLNMSILLCLTEDGVSALPKTQTKLFEKFIVMTIVHFLRKHKEIPTTQTISLPDLPHPYDQVFKELSQFAFHAFQKNQLVFTITELKETCPTLTSSNWFEFGLLKPAGYFKSQDGSEYQSFHFLHFSLQEYLAAYHIATLPDKLLLKLLKSTFWNVQYHSTWVMYVGITGGNNVAFKHFFNGNHFKVLSRLFGTSSTILSNKTKCLHLLRCLREADHQMLLSVQNIFQGGIINLSHQSLSPNDMRTLSILLLRSPNKQWEMINLSHCNIDDKACIAFCEAFQKVNLTIRSINVSYNSFTLESLSKLCTILRSCDTEKLIISVDSLHTTKEMNVVNKISKLWERTVDASTVLDTIRTGVMLVAFVEELNRMIVVQTDFAGWFYIKQFDNININDYDRIVETLKHTGEECTKTVNFLFSSFHLVKLCGSNMHSKGVYLLNMPSKVEYECNSDRFAMHQYTADFLAAVIINTFKSNTSYLKALPPDWVNMFKSMDRPIRRLDFDVNISNEAADDVAIFLSHNTKLELFCIGKNNLETAGVVKIARGLQNISSLISFSISSNNIGSEAADDIAAVLSRNTKLQFFNICYNSLETTGAIKIAKGLFKNVFSLNRLDISGNNIGSDAADDIAAVLSHNNKLQVFCIDANNLETTGAIKIARGLQNISSLIIFSISTNNIGSEAADDIAAVLSHNNKLRHFYIDTNNLETEGAIKIARGLQNISFLTILSISNNNIGSEAADDIAAVLSCNTELQEFNMNDNNLETAGAMKIAKGLRNISSITKFNISNNNIGSEAADDIAAVLSHNTKLQYFYIHTNNLGKAGAIKIARGLQNVLSLKEFDISNNNLGSEAVDEITDILHHNTKLLTNT